MVASAAGILLPPGMRRELEVMLAKLVKGEIEVPFATLQSGVAPEDPGAPAGKASRKRRQMKENRKHSTVSKPSAANHKST
jgi:hypothetical protein